MSSVASPFGMKPAWSPSGIVRVFNPGAIESGYNTAIFQNGPVAVDANGFLTAAAPNTRILGTFQGVEYTDVLGRRVVSNQWVANTVATDIIAYYTEDPNMVYEIQANATLTRAAIGQQYDWTALAGNTTTGLSSVALDVASAAANAGVRVVGLNPGPDNAWGDLFPVVQVQVSEHQYVADRASV